MPVTQRLQQLRRFVIGDRQDPLGTDLVFPIQPDMKGDLAPISGQDNLLQALQVLAYTIVGEVLFHRRLGSDLPLKIHDPASDVVRRRIARGFERAVMRHETRVRKIECDCEETNVQGQLSLMCRIVDNSYRLEQNVQFPIVVEREA